VTPPSAAPLPPPPAASYPDAPAGRAFDPASVHPFDWAILAAGVLALIFSMLNYYTATVSAEGQSRSVSVNAWHGFFGWFGVLVALAAAIMLAIHVFAPSTKFPVPARLIVLGGFALSLLCTVIAAFVTPDAKSSSELSALTGVKVSVDYGRGIGFWLCLVVILAGGVLSFLRLRGTGGTLPWEQNKA
jgi:hypothetical protein